MLQQLALPPPSVKELTGSQFAYELRNSSPELRASMALDLMAGDVVVKQLTMADAVKLTGANKRAVKARQHSEAGVSFEMMRQTQALDRLIQRLIDTDGGLERLYNRLEELTRPAS